MLMNPMPPCRPHTGDSDLDRISEPSRFYAHPNDVLVDQRLNLSEKRAILASWASDECAVRSMPTLRVALWSPIAVTFDDVMEALQKLDREPERQPLKPAKRGVNGGSNATL